MRFIKGIFLGLALSASIAGTAQASELPLTKTVRYGDLNLDQDSGIHTLYRRIQRAARTVCRPLERRDLSLKTRHSECMIQAIDSSVAEIGGVRLLAFHETQRARMLSSVRRFEETIAPAG